MKNDERRGTRPMWAGWVRQLQAWWRPPLGRRGERLAAKHLKQKGYRIIVHSARETAGEIDLVARDGATWVFVEVKTRTNAEHGEPWEAVGPVKQRQIGKAARQFLHRRRLHDVAMRFDVVSVVWPADGGRPTVTHFPNAFIAPGIP